MGNIQFVMNFVGENEVPGLVQWVPSIVNELSPSVNAFHSTFLSCFSPANNALCVVAAPNVRRFGGFAKRIIMKIH